jgi:hypothetical protein
MAPRSGFVSTQASQNEPIETYSFWSGPTISERVWWFGLPGMSAPAGNWMISWAVLGSSQGSSRWTRWLSAA